MLRAMSELSILRLRHSISRNFSQRGGLEAATALTIISMVWSASMSLPYSDVIAARMQLIVDNVSLVNLNVPVPLLFMSFCYSI